MRNLIPLQMVVDKIRASFPSKPRETKNLRNTDPRIDRWYNHIVRFDDLFKTVDLYVSFDRREGHKHYGVLLDGENFQEIRYKRDLDKIFGSMRVADSWLRKK